MVVPSLTSRIRPAGSAETSERALCCSIHHCLPYSALYGLSGTSRSVERLPNSSVVPSLVKVSEGPVLIPAETTVNSTTTAKRPHQCLRRCVEHAIWRWQVNLGHLAAQSLHTVRGVIQRGLDFELRRASFLFQSRIEGSCEGCILRLGFFAPVIAWL